MIFFFGTRSQPCWITSCVWKRRQMDTEQGKVSGFHYLAGQVGAVRNQSRLLPFKLSPVEINISFMSNHLLFSMTTNAPRHPQTGRLWSARAADFLVFEILSYRFGECLKGANFASPLLGFCRVPSKRPARILYNGVVLCIL